MSLSSESKLATIGERIKFIREDLRISRSGFARKHGFPVVTLYAWEHSKTSITPASLKKLMQAFASENVLCTEEWLKNGTGSPPQFTGSLLQKEFPISKDGDNLSAKDIDPLNLEVALFKKLHPSSLVTCVNDNYMVPFYSKGDYVGGVKIDFKEGKFKFGIPHLVVLQDNSQFVRVLYQGSKKKSYTLGCPNYLNQRENPILIDANIKEVYGILWHFMAS